MFAGGFSRLKARAAKKPLTLPSPPRDRLRIAVDLDGVLAESMLVWCEKVNLEFGKQLKMDDLDSWASWEKFSISKDDFYRILDESWEDWRQVPPTEPRIAGKVARIEPFGEIDIVTGRSKSTEDAARSWVENHGIRYRRFVRVAGWRDKIVLNYDVYIDDAPDLMPLVSQSPLSRAILYDRPWNRNVPSMPRMVRAQGWKEIPSLLKQFQKTESKEES
jgi:5'(3')-deoxyribonucleotidase